MLRSGYYNHSVLVRRICICLVAAFFVAALPSPAFADNESRAAKRLAKKSLDAGDRALKKGLALSERGDAEEARSQYEDALASYQRAYEAVPNPQIYFAIGRAEELLGRHKDAYSHYRRMLEEANELGERLSAAVRARIEAVSRELAFVDLEVAPDDAAVFVDSREVGIAPLSEPLVLEPGTYRIEVRHDGYVPQAEELDVSGGQQLKKSIELKPIPRVEEVEQQRRERERPPAPPRGLLFGSLAVTGGLLVATSVTGALALSRHGVYSDESLDLDERNGARDRGKSMVLATDILAGATVVSAALTIYYYYGVYRPRRQRSMALDTAVNANVTSEGATFSVSGRF